MGSIFNLIRIAFTSSWYIVLPEVLSLAFFGVRFFGPAGVAVVLLYLIAVAVFPVQAMAAVGTVMFAHAVFIAVKNFAGDRIAKSKETAVDDGTNGVPRLSGHDKAVQDELDRMKVGADSSAASETSAGANNSAASETSTGAKDKESGGE